MQEFKLAFERFEKTGYFELTETQLNLSQIKQLHAHLKKKIKTPDFKKYSYQFHLHHVDLVPHGARKIADTKPAITGAVNSQEYARQWNDRATDRRLLNLSGGSVSVVTPVYITPLETARVEKHYADLEEALSSLLNMPGTWYSIILDKVNLLAENQNLPLSHSFQLNLLKSLLENVAAHAKTLGELSLKPLSTRSKSELIHVLNHCTNLHTLHLALDSPTNNHFLQDISPALEKHPKLRRLDVSDILLDEFGYGCLSRLLDENYRIDRIDLPPEPSDEVLALQHQALTGRLAELGVKRFELEHISQERLLELAVNALENKDMDCFVSLLSQQSSLPAIMAKENSDAITLEYKTLLDVYRHHPDYVNLYASRFQLNLQRPYREAGEQPSKTVGYFLLEKAFSAQNADGVKHLLTAGANLLEHSNEESALLRQLFIKKECPSWKKEVVQYLQRDLTVLVPPVSRLAQFSNVYVGLLGIKKHLDIYLTKLIERRGWPLFLQVMSGVFFHFEDRTIEWKRALETNRSGFFSSH